MDWAIKTAIALMLTVLGARSALADACEQVAFEETKYVICTVDMAKASLRLFWKSAGGKPYVTFSKVAEAVSSEGRTLAFAMNAGMYSPDFAPVGLYVENGQEMQAANSGDPPISSRQVPNFYKKPNGVFFMGGTTAGIMPTEDYLAQKPDAAFATQSGPMLVIHGMLHPALLVGSTDRTRRSGVGVCDGDKVSFAISEDDVNFYDFARLFRDRLKCPDALFLDGGRGTGLYDPAMKRNDVSGHGGYGPMVGLVE